MPLIGADLPPAPPEQGGSRSAESAYVVMASPQIREALGPALKYLPQWAGMSVLVVKSPQRPKAGDPFPIQAGTGWGGLQSRFAQVAAGLSEPRTLSKSVPEEIRNYWARTGEITILENIFESVPPEQIVATNLSLSFPGQRTASPICIISLPEREETTEKSGIIAGLLGGAVRVPGSVLDWRAAALAHETAHCRKGHYGPLVRPITETEILYKEAEADKLAREFYRDFEKREGGNPEVAEALIDYRILGHFNGYAIEIGKEITYATEDHVTTPLVREGLTAQETRKGLAEALTHVHRKIGEAASSDSLCRNWAERQSGGPQYQAQLAGICESIQNPFLVYRFAQAALNQQNFESGSPAEQVARLYTQAVERWVPKHVIENLAAR